MLEMQRSQSQREIETIKRSEYSISLLRHDMHHFLANVTVFIDNDETEKAKEYINEIVNMVLSSHEQENGARANGCLFGANCMIDNLRSAVYNFYSMRN